MSDINRPGPRVMEEEAPRPERRPGAGPAVFATEVSERVVPRERALVAPAPPARAKWRDRWIRLGFCRGW